MPTRISLRGWARIHSPFKVTEFSSCHWEISRRLYHGQGTAGFAGERSSMLPRDRRILAQSQELNPSYELFDLRKRFADRRYVLRLE